MSVCAAALAPIERPKLDTGRKVVRLEYECYPVMADKEMRKICSAVREKWAVKGIAILHRLG